ncbi:MAG: DUF2461 domain-containing protein [Anaerolineae bacterium]
MDFAALVQFLAELEQNNNKPWFEANRKRYDALRADFTDLVEEVVFGVATFDRRISGVAAKDCLFRIYRDVRFSKDKSPYKTQFSAAITEAGKNTQTPAYYFEVNHEGQLFIGGGIYMPETERLNRIRAYVATFPRRLQEVLDDPAFKATFGTLDGPRLTRPPKGYDETTPMLDMVKLKSFTVGRDADARALDDATAVPLIVNTFRAMYPFVGWLRDSLGYTHTPA